jgi:hypothetical protein
MGSVRRECLDHVVVFNEASLRADLEGVFAILCTFMSHTSAQI